VPVVVLIDTNVWVSAFINPHGYPAKLKAAWTQHRFEAVISVALLDELAEVLARPRILTKYRLDPGEISEFLRLLAARALKVTPTGGLRVCRDPDDNVVLETALLGHASYAVSRDDDIKRDRDLVAQMEARGIKVLSVQQFVDLLAEGRLHAHKYPIGSEGN
jgi:putative PIN family toxin of toxin-antitoxin system